jgi:hypothetical protein
MRVDQVVENRSRPLAALITASAAPLEKLHRGAIFAAPRRRGIEPPCGVAAAYASATANPVNRSARWEFNSTNATSAMRR